MHYKIIISTIFAAGISIHVYFLQINTILKDSLSYEYLKLAKYLANGELGGLGNGSIGFLYSLFISIFEKFVNIINQNFFSGELSDTYIISAKVLNIFLLLVSGILLYVIGKKYLFKTYNYLLLTIFFLSPTIIRLNTDILSENLLLPLFLGLFLLLDNFINEIGVRREVIKVRGITVELNNKKDIIIISFLIAVYLTLIYFTKPYAYIIVFGIILIIFHLVFINKESSFTKGISSILLISGFFLLLISPFLIFINNLYLFTGEERISSNEYSYSYESEYHIQNLDIIKEKNNHELINGFIENQKNIFSSIIPGIVISDILKAYENKNFIFGYSKFFLIFVIFPFFIIVYGILKLLFTKIIILTDKRNFMLISFYMFVCFSIFLSLSYVTQKELIIFLPIILVLMIYGGQEILYTENTDSGMISYMFKYFWIVFILSGLFISGARNYYSTYNYDYMYLLKKDLGTYLKKEEGKSIEELRIMEEVPIFTYYAGNENRYKIPLLENLDNLLKYAKDNKIDLLVVDNLEFLKNHPDLNFLLEHKKKNKGLELYVFYDNDGKKIVIYKII